MATVPNPLIFNVPARKTGDKRNPALDPEEAARARENQSSPSDLTKPESKGE